MTDRPTVVVTGLGATTPLGGDVASTWEGMLAGNSGVTLLEDEWARDFPARLVARMAVEPTSALERVEARRLDRCQQAALVAGREAWADAGFDPVPKSKDGVPNETVRGVDPERLAIVVGSGIGGATTMLGQDDILEERGVRRVSPLTVPMLMPNGPAACLSLEFGARAGVHATVSACASGAEAISLAADLIRLGRADVVVAGGTEAVVDKLPMAGFAQMRAMSTRNEEPERASRPFDKGRDGFVLGEGAGILILESAEHAAARGARVYAEIAGAGITSDGYHITAPDPSGSGAARAIRLALRDAGVDPADVVHVNAHATSTPTGDVAEAAAIRAALGDRALVSAPKSMLGHLLGAAGAVETIATVLSVRDGVVPVTRNLEDLDDDVELDVVSVEPLGSDLFVFISPAAETSFLTAIRRAAPQVTVPGFGRSMVVVKDVGAPAAICARYGIPGWAGYQGIGHTRMATESAVTTAHSHPFAPAADLALVHNGSFSNYATVRGRLARQGIRCDTDNDSEVAARLVAARMAEGADLADGLRAVLKEMDGFFTLLVTTRTQFAVVRDSFACKPAVIAETPDYVAMASEY
ncbi:MAG TPA: beta-ketoacyl-ACP synthase II, partial [Mycobacteriales bacterium]|nr:beta-ketoacyl-ACP synthase II [Mycobacteriales bacterium]